MNPKKTVLVVDDEKSVLGAMTDMLSAHGYLVRQAKNGQQGLSEAVRLHPDLILLDILMPDMDGMTMLKKLREDPWGKDVPVILLTNLNPTDEQVVKDVVLCKPLHYFIKADHDIHEILAAVVGAIGD